MKVKVPSVENSKGRRVFLSVLSVSGIRHVFELKFSHSQLIPRHSIKCIRNIRVYPPKRLKKSMKLEINKKYFLFWNLSSFQLQSATLVCRIDVHARLLILRKKFPLHGLIWPCTFIAFEKKILLHVYFSAFIRVFALHVY